MARVWKKNTIPVIKNGVLTICEEKYFGQIFDIPYIKNDIRPFLYIKNDIRQISYIKNDIRFWRISKIKISKLDINKIMDHLMKIWKISSAVFRVNIGPFWTILLPTDSIQRHLSVDTGVNKFGPISGAVWIKNVDTVFLVYSMAPKIHDL